MDEKKKYRLNVIDVIVVVLIVAVLGFVGYKLANRGGGGGEQNLLDVTYTVKCEGVDNRLYENCQKYLPSQLMASGVLYNGWIEAVEREDHLVSDGAGNWVSDPQHSNLYFTVSLKVPEMEVQTTKVGEQEVRVGKSDYILKSQNIEFNKCEIVDVVWEKAQ